MYDEITIKQFLSSFNDFEHGAAYESFEVFKETVKTLCEDFAWDLSRGIVCEVKDAERPQSFELPDDNVIQEWYESEEV